MSTGFTFTSDEPQARATTPYEGKNRFEALANAIPHLVWAADPAGVIDYANERWIAYTGAATPAGSCTDWLRCVHPDDRDASERAWTQAVRSGSPYEFAHRLKRSDGAYRWHISRGNPHRGPDGAIVRWFATSTDIDELRRMSDVLHDQAQMLASIRQAIVALDPDGTVISWNAHAEALFGWSAREALGHDLRELLWQVQDLPDADNAIALVRGGATMRRERVVHCKDGRQAYVSVNAAPLVGANGATRQIVVTYTDLTERRQLEQQFQQAQKMEAVGRLAGGVAHDFNNLLTVINGSVEFLGETIAPDHPAHPDVEEIARAANRAASLTRQLLAFSRRQLLERRVVDPNTTITQLESMLGRLIGEDITLLLSVDPNTPTILADEGQLEQSVMNLVVNARDAMPHGGMLRLQTRLMHVSPATAATHGVGHGGAFAAIIVSDTGTGIEPDVIPRIFEPFFTTKDAGRGTGLGLATVYGIVKQFGGFIEVTSELGAGSTFTMCIPANGQAADDPNTAQAERPNARGSERVLLVEDQDDVRAITRRILSQHGYRVVEARNGAEALTILQNPGEHVDLLVTDAVMPEVSGPDLIRAARPLRPGLPVLVITGYTDEGSLGRADIETHAKFLYKPFRAERLLRAVRGALENRNEN
ncbi:MAG TPA: PAS domain S-box protein [Gemmatimonadaceae bacterium]|nr:PAS domain S-box protein [Gemmatimonadaceae bacterium]